MNSSAADTRTAALSTPVIAMVTKHTSARLEKRRAATSAWAPRRWACTSSAARPPAHSDAASRWMTNEFVARSCEPPAEECPVSPSGSRLPSATTSRAGVHTHRSATRHPTARTKAMAAVHAQDWAVSTLPMIRTMVAGSSASAKGWPAVSDSVSGTMSAAQTHQVAAAALAIRNAR